MSDEITRLRETLQQLNEESIQLRRRKRILESECKRLPKLPKRTAEARHGPSYQNVRKLFERKRGLIASNAQLQRAIEQASMRSVCANIAEQAYVRLPVVSPLSHFYSSIRDISATDTTLPRIFDDIEWKVDEEMLQDGQQKGNSAVLSATSISAGDVRAVNATDTGNELGKYIDKANNSDDGVVSEIIDSKSTRTTMRCTLSFATVVEEDMLVRLCIHETRLPMRNHSGNTMASSAYRQRDPQEKSSRQENEGIPCYTYRFTSNPEIVGLEACEPYIIDKKPPIDMVQVALTSLINI
ncbi:hypothetical protein SARC_12738 [Sphaeroforma arctica JP610]|uniref:Uncharacterized protein n=1 Tax=Sphaeroforma arctica JP610 TaxID=667725 RepID=A0A0L0FD80_9EUKA|nr:hypothetical protein SARC_12738 [Sphaeroforma arctica JP610]KNC74724.1 hypothetical protein SARC_12738 [Sphaeroforma arctica JP610]|eukprot:XP_014148626.1 hypothetical protein SARC_12738 [Sphaeroforma arctica JP610]